MKPGDYSLDLFVSYTSGHLKGWLDSGGDPIRWMEYKKMSLEEVNAMSARLVEMTKRVDTFNGGGLDVASAWVVVWDHKARALGTMLLSDALGANAEAVADDEPSQSTILSVWESQDKANSAIESLEPMFLRKMT